MDEFTCTQWTISGICNVLTNITDWTTGTNITAANDPGIGLCAVSISTAGIFQTCIFHAAYPMNENKHSYWVVSQEW